MLKKLPLSADVPEVHVRESAALRVRLNAVQLRTRRARAVVVQVRRMIRGEMNGRVDAEPVAHPVQEIVDLLL